MKLGLQFNGGEAERLIERHGVTTVPAGLPQVLAQKPEDLKRSFESKGLSICYFAFFGFNPVHPDTEKVASARAQLEQAMPLVGDAGCSDIVINGGNYTPGANGFGAAHPDNFSPGALDDVARQLAPLLELAERHSVFLSIEPYIHCVVNSPERFLSLKEKTGSDHLTICLDVCNFYHYADLWQPTQHADRVCSALAGHYRFVHVKDMKFTPGFHLHIDETTLDQGVTDWAAVLRHVQRDLPPTGAVVLEHMKTAQEVDISMAELKAAATQAGMAFDPR